MTEGLYEVLNMNNMIWKVSVIILQISYEITFIGKKQLYSKLLIFVNIISTRY